GKQVLADAEQHAAVRGCAAEPSLRKQPVDDDQRAEAEGEPVDRPGPEPQGSVVAEHEQEAEGEQQLLPRRDRLEDAAADAGSVQLGHREVVDRESDHEDVEDPDGPSHAGPIATSVAPLRTTRTGYGNREASSRGPRGSRTSSNPRARRIRRRSP